MDLHAEDGALGPTLRTDRLTLRPVRQTDAAAIVAALNVWDVTRWLSVVPFPYTPDDADYFITTVAGDPQRPHWAIDMDAGLVGQIGRAHV